eukprot:4027253-Alexandrium_andersonii.AAC.1
MKEARPYYMGELVQLHGFQDAHEFVREGNYAEFEDAQGGKYYRKAQQVEAELGNVEDATAVIKKHRLTATKQMS